MIKNKRLLLVSLISALLLVVVAVIFSAAHLTGYNDNKESANRITSTYEDSRIDFVVPSPSQTQIEDMKKEEHINGVFPCYTIYTDFKLPTKSLSDYVLLLDSVNDLDHTMFKDSRIAVGNEEIGENSLLIDEAFASQHKLKVGDAVEWKISSTESVTLVVDRIYYENEIDSTRMVVFNMGKQKEIISRLTSSAPLSPNSAYIDSSDIAKTDEMLKSYQPLGRLKTSEDFDTYTAYEEYLADFNDEDYYAQIIKTESYRLENAPKAEQYEKEASKSRIVLLAIVLLVSLFVPVACDIAGKTTPTVANAIQQKGASYKALLSSLLKSKAAVAVVTAVACVASGAFVLGFVDALVIVTASASIVGVATSAVILVMSVNKAVKVKKK